MKIVLSGSLGNISKPLTIGLVEKGHHVTVISSRPERKKDIEALGGAAAIGSIDDTSFLVNTFSGADAVYTMVPPNNYFDHSLDLIAYYQKVGAAYAEAIKQTGVKRLVNLSTFGAHLEKGNGILLGAHHVEQTLNQLAADVAITHMRPTSFYYNLLGYIHGIKALGAISVNYGTKNVIPWVSPADIASAISEEFDTPASGTKIRYVASEELTGSETALVLGAAIGKPDLQWILITDEEQLNALKAAGMNPQIAAGLVELYAALQSGLLTEDYILNKPAVMGATKLRDFAKDFAKQYHSI